MVPNLDLILLAFLHGSFISCTLLVLFFVVLICLLLAISVTLFSILLIYSYDIFCWISLYSGAPRANVELGFVLLLCTLMHFRASLASKLSFEPAYTNIRAKARRFVCRSD